MRPESITSRRVLSVAIPILFANVTVPILGAVDTGVIGQLGLAAPIGAVGVGAIIISFIFWTFGFLRMGTTGLTAQAIGAEDRREASALLIRGLLIGGAAGLGFIALQIPLFWAAFQLSPASAEVEALARDYMAIRIWGAPAAIATFAMTGWLIGSERTRAVLILQFWINGLNVALDLWFVLGLGWGVPGVAAATLIAEWSGLALGLWICRAALRPEIIADRALVFARERLRRMAAVNTDIMIRSILLQIGFGIFIFRTAAFGDVTLAANQVLIQFLHITAYALDGFAFAAEALVGQALGARSRPALRRAAILSGWWGLGCVSALALFFWVAGPALIALMTTAPDVRAEADHYRLWLALAPLIGLPAWMFDGIFVGATRSRDMRNAMLISLPAFLIALAVLTPIFGNHGLWASMMIFSAFRGLTLAVKYPALEASAEAASRRDSTPVNRP